MYFMLHGEACIHLRVYSYEFVPGAYEYVVLNCPGVYSNERVDVSQSHNGYVMDIS